MHSQTQLSEHNYTTYVISINVKFFTLLANDVFQPKEKQFRFHSKQVWDESWSMETILEAKKEQYVRSCGGRGRGALFYMRFKQLW